MKKSASVTHLWLATSRRMVCGAPGSSACTTTSADVTCEECRRVYDGLLRQCLAPKRRRVTMQMTAHVEVLETEAPDDAVHRIVRYVEAALKQDGGWVSETTWKEEK